MFCKLQTNVLQFSTIRAALMFSEICGILADVLIGQV